MSPQRTSALIVAWFGIIWLSGPAPAVAQSVNVFQGFTGHIERQIQRDQQSFHDAEICTEWFYKQEKKSGQPKATPTLFMTDSTATADTPLRPAWMQDSRIQAGGLAPRDLDVLLRVRLGLSGFRAPVSHGVWAVSSRTVTNNVGEGIVFSGRRQDVYPAIQTSDCPARYPGGLTAARLDFSSTQSALSLSLTFYEFALVSDRNDDGRYNSAELQDVLESFELTYDRNRPDSIHLIVLTGTFDSVRKAGGMERLMTSMGMLYDKGYRLTPHDRSTLDHLTR